MDLLFCQPTEFSRFTGRGRVRNTEPQQGQTLRKMKWDIIEEGHGIVNPEFGALSALK
jgi:hypothetical protein